MVGAPIRKEGFLMPFPGSGTRTPRTRALEIGTDPKHFDDTIKPRGQGYFADGGEYHDDAEGAIDGSQKMPQAPTPFTLRGGK